MSNKMWDSPLLIMSVWKHAPLLASYILIVASLDDDATQAESCEKATKRTSLLCLWSVLRHAPLLASQILTVLSYDADAIQAESCEKATELTPSLCPSSVDRQGLYFSSIIGFIVIPFGSSL